MYKKVITGIPPRGRTGARRGPSYLDSWLWPVSPVLKYVV